MTLKCTMILGDCLEVMPTLHKKSVQMCFADIPFATANHAHTANIWDRPLKTNKIIKSAVEISDGPLIFMASARLASLAISSHPKLFKYDLVWQKTRASGHLNARRMPMRAHEWLLVFAESVIHYSPQMTMGQPRRSPYQNFGNCESYGAQRSIRRTNLSGAKHPTSIVTTKPCVKSRIHPTQKPVALLDWLVRTYSGIEDQVLDPVSGSGVTAISALSNGRHVTCIEKDQGYLDASCERVAKHIKDNAIDAKLQIRR